MKTRSIGTSAARRAGFTLVEVLLTLLIMSAIMLSMTQILTAARTSRDTIHNIQETQLVGPAILDMIERDLRGIVTYDRTRDLHLRVKNRVMLGFDGDSIDFVTSNDSLVPLRDGERFLRTDMCEVGYRLRPSPDSDQFLEIYRREGYGVDDQPFDGGSFTLLCSRVKSFDVQCFKKDGPDEDPVEEWGTERAEDANGLPARIEITMILELAPRIVNEQLRIAPIDRRTIVYKRVIRLPEALRANEDAIPIPKIPKPPAPANNPGAPGGAGGAGQGGGGNPQGGGTPQGGTPPPGGASGGGGKD